VNDGVFVTEIYKECRDDFEALAKKGIPKIMADYTIFHMLMNDELYFNKDFALYS
jgi:hypothetical protein